MNKRIGIIGARGHVGSELIRLILAHPLLELAFVSSRERAGQPLRDHEPNYHGDLAYVALGPQQAAEQVVDALVLALPNGMAGPYVQALDAQALDTVVIDLSADYRFNDDWYYGLPELTRSAAPGKLRISNPGCYATAMQLALAPVLDLLTGPAQCFGVSGYSGAGTTPSDKNNPEKLRDNLLPYALTGHLHEREVSRHLAHPVEFMPHVAAYFRGITMTVNMHFSDVQQWDALWTRYQVRYAGEKLLRLSENAPWVQMVAGSHYAEVGGLTLAADGLRAVIVCVLDNLLKGAATQAMQNLNLALGLPECESVTVAGMMGEEAV
ncbi:MAG: N-acetyl-gamma-glutamyl-phosphate reductase [Pseudomonadota bacterium]|nr:N-acetyl-gamma-glutamyl-phosphate reductase [Pseudomonadota bacterium]